MRVQIITQKSPDLIDRNAEKYVIINCQGDTDTIADSLGKKHYLVGKDIYRDNYYQRSQKVEETVRKWVSVLGRRMNERYGLELADDQYRLIWYIQLYYYIWSYFWKVDLMDEILKYGEPYIQYHANNMTRPEYDADTYTISEEFHSNMWARIFMSYGYDVFEVAKETDVRSDKSRLRKNRRLSEIPYRLNYHIAHYFEKKRSLPETADGCMVTNSRLPKRVEDEIIRKGGNGNISFVYDFQFVEKGIDLLQGINYDRELRDWIFSDYGETDVIIREAFEMAKDYFSIQYLEVFDKAYSFGKSISNNWSLKRFYHSGMHWITAYVAAALRGKGIPIYYIQHSGGERMFYYDRRLERGASDRVITWGGKKEKDMIPVAMNRVPDIKNRWRKKRRKIVYFVPVFTTFFDNGAGVLMDGYLSRVKQFIEGMPQDIRAKLVIRTCVDTFNTSFVKWIKTIYPEIKFEDCSECLSYTSMLESEFVIFDNYSTGIQEAMLLDVPFVFYEGVDNLKCPDEFKELRKKLVEANVFFDSAEELDEVMTNDISRLFNVTEEKKEAIKQYMIYTTGLQPFEKNTEKWLREFLR